MTSNAVDPGWVPTRMGGPGAPDDMAEGHLTQVRLAVGNDPIAQRSGQVLHHQRTARTATAAQDTNFQDRLFNRLAELTGFELPQQT